MIQKVQGIVLGSINYNDKYILVQIYTDILGKVTYMVPKVNTRGSRVARSSFSPLAILEMEVEHRANRDIQRIKEAHTLLPLFSISTDIKKSSAVFFLSEFLSKILKDANESDHLFQYLFHSVQVLELAEQGIANFHLVFILNLTRFLGFQPNLEDYTSGDIFDMLNGVFVNKQPLHKHYISREDSAMLSKLARINYENMHLFKFSRQDRINIINRIIEYYRIHLNDFPPIKSLDVLHQLF